MCLPLSSSSGLHLDDRKRGSQIAAIAVAALSQWHINVVWNTYDASGGADFLTTFAMLNPNMMNVVWRSGLIADCVYLQALP